MRGTDPGREPDLEVAASESPLPTHPHRRDVPGADEPVDGSDIHPKDRHHFFGGQKRASDPVNVIFCHINDLTLSLIERLKPDFI
jgi:hypothetical protein